MADLIAHTRKVYRAPTARRDYFTARAAARKEADALLKRKYPTERSHTDDHGRVEDPGWHYTSDDRLCRVHDRLARLLLRKLRAAAKEGDTHADT